MSHYLEETSVRAGVFEKACPLAKEASIQIRNTGITDHHISWSPLSYFKPKQGKVTTMNRGVAYGQVMMVAAFPLYYFFSCLENITSTFSL